MANSTAYGLSRDRVHELAGPGGPASGGRSGAGTVWVNTFLVRDLTAPFGGAGHLGHRSRGGRLRARLLLGPEDASGPRGDRRAEDRRTERGDNMSVVGSGAGRGGAARRVGQAAPARARGARPGVLHRRRVGAAHRGGRRSGGDVPGDGQQGRPVHVHPARDHPGAVRGRLRGDEPARDQRGRVLRLRRAWSRQGLGGRRRVHRADRLQRDADRDLRAVRRRHGRVHGRQGRDHARLVVVVPDRRRDHRRARRAADRPQRPRARGAADPRGRGRRAVRLRDPGRSRPAGRSPGPASTRRWRSGPRSARR